MAAVKSVDPGYGNGELSVRIPSEASHLVQGMDSHFMTSPSLYDELCQCFFLGAMPLRDWAVGV